MFHVWAVGHPCRRYCRGTCLHPEAYFSVFITIISKSMGAKNCNIHIWWVLLPLWGKAQYHWVETLQLTWPTICHTHFSVWAPKRTCLTATCAVSTLTTALVWRMLWHFFLSDWRTVGLYPLHMATSPQPHCGATLRSPMQNGRTAGSEWLGICVQLQFSTKGIFCSFEIFVSQMINFLSCVVRGFCLSEIICIGVHVRCL